MTLGNPRIDDELDALAPDARRALPIRLALAVVLGLILGDNLGWGLAAAWIPVGLASCVWGMLAWGPRGALGDDRARSRVSRLAEILTSSAVCAFMAIPYWLSGDPAFQVMAVVLLMSMLMAAQSFAFHSPLAGALFGAMPALAFFTLPITLGPASGLKLLSVVAFQGLALAYLSHLAHLIILNRRALRETQGALVRETQAAVAANQSKSAFLAMMSHELRTPMTGVLGMAHALTLTKLDTRQLSHVDMLVRSGKGLMAILNDILDISKIEAGKLELELIPFDLHELGQQVHDLWSETASAQGVKLVYDLAPATPRWVTGDPTRLRQIMINLISNALKFTREGEVRLSIRSVAGEGCEIAVADTGPGISGAQQGRLFQAFAQVDASTVRKFGGTGLGLAICRQLATLMGGDIRLSSREGEGSVFTVSVPLPEAVAAQPAEPDTVDVSLAGLRILVADDNAINLAVARAILEAFGASLATAGNGAEALDLLRREPVDLVLMDIHMPIMDGFEALTRLRAGEGGPNDVPVIALTADAMTGAIEALLAAGFDGVAPKPINPQQLVGMIAAVRTPAPAHEVAPEGDARAFG